MIFSVYRPQYFISYTTSQQSPVTRLLLITRAWDVCASTDDFNQLTSLASFSPLSHAVSFLGGAATSGIKCIRLENSSS